jgi:hypothetical protein
MGREGGIGLCQHDNRRKKNTGMIQPVLCATSGELSQVRNELKHDELKDSVLGLINCYHLARLEGSCHNVAKHLPFHGKRWIGKIDERR